MVALLLDLENLTHRSFVAEAYRTVERAHGRPPALCVAFGSPIHVEHTRALASRLDVELVATTLGLKNAADHAIVSVAKALEPHRYRTIVVGSGDRGYLKWLRALPARGQRLECVSREHQLCKEADASYGAVYRMDAKRMTLPSLSDLRLAAIDCIPQLATAAVNMEVATSLMRASRIAPRNTPGRVFFARYPTVFQLASDGRELGLVRPSGSVGAAESVSDTGRGRGAALTIS